MACQHETVRIVRGEFGPHYAKRVCTTCGKFRGWEPKPANGGREATEALPEQAKLELYPDTTGFALCPSCDLTVRFGKPMCPDCRSRFRAFHRLDAGEWRGKGDPCR